MGFADGDVELLSLLEALDRLVEEARPTRFGDRVVVDRLEVYDVIDGFLRSLPGSIAALRWLRNRRAEDGDPPLGSSEISGDDALSAILALEDFVRRGNGTQAARSSKRPRVKRSELVRRVSGLHSLLDPLARELADYESIYGNELQAARERAARDEAL